MNLDYYFFYKYNIRYITILKYNGVFSIFAIPNIAKMLFCFNLKNLKDMDDVQSYNYFYVFRFFFGRCGYINNYRSSFKLGLWSYSFKIVLTFNNIQDIYYNLYYIGNDLLAFLDKSAKYIKLFSLANHIYNLHIKDSNIFGEKKTNLGLFSLKQQFNIKFWCIGLDLSANCILFKNMKFFFNIIIWSILVK